MNPNSGIKKHESDFSNINSGLFRQETEYMNEISLFCIKIDAKNPLTWDMSGLMIEPDLPTRKRPAKERSTTRDIFNNFSHKKETY
jgi:hypothetical protein